MCRRLLRRKPTAAENVSWEMINRLHGPVSDDVSTNDWAHWEVKAESEIALITTLSEDWNLERADGGT